MMKKLIASLMALTMTVSMAAVSFGTETEEEQAKTTVKVLLLPKFEVDELAGDYQGEAQYYYERYLDGAESYEIDGGPTGSRLYVKDGVALYMLGMGKVSAARSTMAVLSDERFDFSQACIISTGCAGSAAGYGV